MSEEDNKDHEYELSSLGGNDGESYIEILSTKSLGSSRRRIKDLLKIFGSRSEMVGLMAQYKFLALSSTLALIGLVITIRMVSTRSLDDH